MITIRIHHGRRHSISVSRISTRTSDGYCRAITRYIYNHITTDVNSIELSLDEVNIIKDYLNANKEVEEYDGGDYWGVDDPSDSDSTEEVTIPLTELVNSLNGCQTRHHYEDVDYVLDYPLSAILSVSNHHQRMLNAAQSVISTIQNNEAHSIDEIRKNNCIEMLRTLEPHIKSLLDKGLIDYTTKVFNTGLLPGDYFLFNQDGEALIDMIIKNHITYKSLYGYFSDTYYSDDAILQRVHYAITSAHNVSIFDIIDNHIGTYNPEDSEYIIRLIDAIDDPDKLSHRFVRSYRNIVSSVLIREGFIGYERLQDYERAAYTYGDIYYIDILSIACLIDGRYNELNDDERLTIEIVFCELIQEYQDDELDEIMRDKVNWTLSEKTEKRSNLYDYVIDLPLLRMLQILQIKPEVLDNVIMFRNNQPLKKHLLEAIKIAVTQIDDYYQLNLDEFDSFSDMIFSHYVKMNSSL